ncbi:MAG: HAMP domain-containing histidine kinase [Bacteroidales bacterium]|nr:HAMP domain-containing histidine kinase [Bacteroidales bacterium]
MLNTRSSLIQSSIHQNEQNPVFQAVLEIADEAIFILEKSGSTIVDCNTSALKLFEATSKTQLLNLPSYRLYNYEPLEYSVDRINNELDKNGQYSQEMSFRTCKQNVFWGKLVQKNIGLTNLNYTILKITKSANYLKDEQWLSEIIKVSSRSTGRQFFKQITKHLSNTFDAEYAFIARRIAGDNSRIKLFYVHGDGVTTKYLKVHGSFIENIMRGYTSFYPTGLIDLFPGDEIISETKANSFIGAPFFDVSGQVLGIIGVLSTSQMEEIPNARYMLNILGSRTAAEIQRIRSKELLRQQTRELAEVNQMKDKLLAVISNDLQAPLNTILGYSGMIRNKADNYKPEELSSKMKVIDNSLRNLYMILESLSDWSRLEQEKVRVEFKPNNIRNILEDIKPYTKYLLEVKQVALINKVPSAINIKADNYLARAAIKSVAAYVIKNTMKSGNVTFDAQIINGHWFFIIRSDKHLADEQEIKFALKASRQEFYTSPKESSVPVLGVYVAREFMQLQNGRLSVNQSPEVIEFLFEFEKG